MQSNTVLTHRWEPTYKAPYKVLGLTSLPSTSLAAANPSAYNNAMASLPKDYRFGMCDICGTGLVHHYLMRDANGKRFVVGGDCVQKSDDTRLITQAKAIALTESRRKAREKREAKQKANLEMYHDKLDRQRVANGGLTDQEVYEAESFKKIIAENGVIMARQEWLTSRIEGKWMYAELTGKFDLLAQPLEKLGDKALSILADIYSKTFPKKERDIAWDNFWERVEEMKEESK